MAIVELQFREQAFGALLQQFINNRRLPSPTLNDLLKPSLANHPLDSITCVGCTLESADTDGQVTANLDLQIRYYDSYADARAAGSLQQPATQVLAQTLPVTLLVQIINTPQGPKPTLAFTVFLDLFPGGQIDLGSLSDFPTQTGALMLDSGVLAIRLGSELGDPVTSPVVNRLAPNSDWTHIVPGDLIAGLFVKSLDAAVAGIADSTHVPGAAATGAYVSTPELGYPPPPFAVASAEVVAVDACPLFNIDISVWLQTVATFVASGAIIQTTVTLSWSADSFWCEVAGFLVLTPIASFVIGDVSSSKASDAVLGRAASPDGFKETGRSDHSITYQQERFLDVPWPLSIIQSLFTDAGLVVAGSIRPQRRGNGLQGWVQPPESNLDVSCTSRSVTVKFYPATVGLYDYDGPGGPPKLFPEWTRVDPANAWIVVPSKDNSWQDLVLTFEDPPTGRLPAGTATSVFLMTDCGLRWIDLGTIPADHAPPTTADVAGMISTCMAKSAGWKERVLAVNWLPRPPDDQRGMGVVRQWLIGLQDLPGAERLEFVAVDEHGRGRVLGVTQDRRNVAVQVTTDANETLEIRSNHTNLRAELVAGQRWIIPFASLRLTEEPVSLAAAGGLLGLRGPDGKTKLVSLDVDGKVRAEPPDPARRAQRAFGRLGAAMDREAHRGGRAWNSAAKLDEHTVAVVHRGSLLIGTVGALQIL